MADNKQSNQEPLSLPDEEKTLNFDDIKDMTVGQVVRKQKEIQDGVEMDDTILDRYIKQHREDIEARKFDTVMSETLPLPEEELAVADNITEVSEEPVATSEVAEPAPETVGSDLRIHKVEQAKAAPLASEKRAVQETVEMVEEEPSNKKTVFIWAALATVFIGGLTTAYLWMNSSNQANETDASTSTTSSQSSSSSDANLVAFEELYASFFTDAGQTKLKNSEFDKLSQLKEALDKLDSSSDAYAAAKSKYEALEKAIQAVQAVNSQFDKPAIVDGELDTTASVNAGATFTAVTTGLSPVDTLLTSAINMGRTQTPVASSAPVSAGTGTGVPSQAQTAPEPVAPAATEVPVETPSAGVTGSVSAIYGIAIPAGVTLQRDLSRVPYNQVAIDDVDNDAWNFNPGVLEKIVATSQERGYITGNQYILEKVNIINGNGYYNMFRPDGTYLFSINCKTGYFVGNGSGYSDALDF